MSFPATFLRLLLLGSLLGAGPALGQRIRIAAANISSGDGQDYDPGHGIRIFKGLKPDIILIQEFNYLTNSASDVRALVDEAFGAGFSYYREGGPGSIPNGIISRYPLLESGEWPSPVAERDFAWARIDLPGARELLAVSVHLPTTDSQRPNEAVQLASFIKDYYAANNGARGSDYLVIGGDFNTDTRSEACLETLSSLVVIGTAHPADRLGNVNTNAGRAKPYDAVYAGKGWHALQTATVLGKSVFPNGLVADTRTYQPIAELAPALAGDSGASNMQHQAVVKDYQLPVAADPPQLQLLEARIRAAAPPQVALAFRSTPGATYEVEATAQLGAGAWATLGSFAAVGERTGVEVVATAAGAGQVQDVLLGAAARRFYRVVRR